MLHVNHFCSSLLQSCQTLCNGMPECRAFVIFTQSGTCIFYDSVGEARPFPGFDYVRRQNTCDDNGERTTLLPRASEGWRKVLFSQMCVCPQGVGGTPTRIRTGYPLSCPVLPAPAPSSTPRTRIEYPQTQPGQGNLPPPGRICHRWDMACAVSLLHFHTGGFSCLLAI